VADHRSGQALVEYVVLLALAGVVAVGTMTIIGPQLTMVFAEVTAAIGDPMGLLASPTPAVAPASVVSSSTTADATPAALATSSATSSTPAPPAVAQPTPVPTTPEHDEGRHRGQGPKS
jgi:Flp pilus assembly pilin Flp